MRAAMAGGKSKRKKWSKNKVREKLQNNVLLDQKLYDRTFTEIPKLKLITTSVVSDRLKLGGSLTRAVLREMAQKGLIRPVSVRGKLAIYTRGGATTE